MVSELKIIGQDRYSEIINQARKNGSLETLMDCIISLTTHKRVTVAPSSKRLEFSVAWFDEGDNGPYMVGGLIYHSKDNFWSIHT